MMDMEEVLSRFGIDTNKTEASCKESENLSEGNVDVELEGNKIQVT